MKGLILCLAIGFLIVGFSSRSFAGGAVSVQWGDDKKPDCDDCGGKYKKKGGPPPHAPAHVKSVVNSGHKIDHAASRCS